MENSNIIAKDNQPIKTLTARLSTETWIKNPCVKRIPIKFEYEENKKLLNLIQQDDPQKFENFLKELKNNYGTELVVKNLFCCFSDLLLKNKSDKQWFDKNTVELRKYLIEPSKNFDFANLHCRVEGDPLQDDKVLKRTEYRMIFTWRILGDISAEASDKMKLACNVTCLLSNEFFLNQINTLSLINLWLDGKNQLVLLAKCLASENNKHRDFLFEEDFKYSKLDQKVYRHFILLSECYLKFNDLFAEHFPRFKKFFKEKYQKIFNDHIHLTTKLIQSRHEEPFYSSLKEYYCYKPHEEIKFTKECKKLEREFDEEKLSKLNIKSILQNNCWDKAFLDAFNELSLGKEYFESIHPIEEKIRNLEIKASKEKSFKHLGYQKSSTWIRGIGIPGAHHPWRI